MMAHKLSLAIVLVFSIFTGLITLWVGGSSADAAEEPVVVSEAVRQQIMASILQIAMYEQASAGATHAAGDRGLASLVAVDGQRFIVTHDHWTHLTGQLDEVEFRNAAGHLLMVLDRTSFSQLITYRDGGTMVLRAPDGLQGVVPVAFVSGAPVGLAETVWLARRSPGNGGIGVEIVLARVEAVETVETRPRLQLRGLDGRGLVPGDSGGGLWRGNSLLGNVWAAGVQNGQATSLIIAAVHPFEGAGRLALAPATGRSGQLPEGPAR